ncbi:MAG: hypothetical protein IT422_04875 [Pirellulaceae bacterium]|nr:hypothetical protein [Pirellulaceae bacterium]
MQELTVIQEQDAEYRREVAAQACGDVELELCDVLTAICRELNRVRERIASHHNPLRNNSQAASVASDLAPDIIRLIGDAYQWDFEHIVAINDSEDRICDHEFTVDEARQHARQLVVDYGGESCET